MKELIHRVPIAAMRIADLSHGLSPEGTNENSPVLQRRVASSHKEGVNGEGFFEGYELGSWKE